MNRNAPGARRRRRISSPSLRILHHGALGDLQTEGTGAGDGAVYWATPTTARPSGLTPSELMGLPRGDKAPVEASMV